MRSDAWAPEEDDFLRTAYFLLKPEILGEELCRTPGAVISRASKLKIRASNTWHRFSEDENTFLRKHYPTWSTARIAQRLKLTSRQLVTHAKHLGLKKTDATRRRILRNNGRKTALKTVHTRFQPGLAPVNKGRKLSVDHYALSAPTMFKKGHPAGNKRPIGSELVDAKGYRRVKVKDDPTVPSIYNWRLKHVVLWEERHGPVPAGHVLFFKDGNKTNVVIENIECISYAERCRRNRRPLTPEMARAIAAKAWKTRRLRTALVQRGVVDPAELRLAKAS